jgi:hypothetical protein
MIGQLPQNRVAPMDARLHHALRYPIASEGASRVSDRIPPPATKPRLSSPRGRVRHQDHSGAARPFRHRDHHGLHAHTQSLRPRRSQPTRFVTKHSRPAEGRNRWAGCYIAPASRPLSALRDRRKRDPHRRGRPDSPVPQFVRSGRPGRGENYTATFAGYQAKA